MALFRTKPRGMWANFETACWKCGGNITITSGKPDRHDCEPQPITLAQLRAALDNR